MSDGLTFKISGGAEVAKMLEQRPPAVARQIIRHSVRYAVEPWRQEMISTVRRGWHVFSSPGQARGLRGAHGQGGREREFGVISKNIRIGTRVNADGFSGSAAVLPSKRAFWARFLEKGFKHVGGKKVGPFAFIRPAFEAREKEVLDRYVADVRAQLYSGFKK